MSSIIRSGIMCPFSGQEFMIHEVTGGFFAQATWHFGAITTSIADKKDTLVAFLNARTGIIPGAPRADRPLTTCPFTGLTVKKRQTSAGWVGYLNTDSVSWHTLTMWDERRLDYFLSSRAGVPPLFSRSELTDVKERTKPEVIDPGAETRMEELKDASREVVDQVVHGAGGDISKPVGRGRSR